MGGKTMFNILLGVAAGALLVVGALFGVAAWQGKSVEEVVASYTHQQELVTSSVRGNINWPDHFTVEVAQ